ACRWASPAAGPPPRPRFVRPGSARASPGRAAGGGLGGPWTRSGCGCPARNRRPPRGHAAHPPGRSRRRTPGRPREPWARSGQGRRSWSGGGGSSFQRLAVLALVVLAVLARADRLPPPLAVAIPVHGPLDALGEIRGGLPAELPQPVGGQGVAAVVPGGGPPGLRPRLLAARPPPGPPPHPRCSPPLRGAPGREPSRAAPRRARRHPRARRR